MRFVVLLVCMGCSAKMLEAPLYENCTTVVETDNSQDGSVDFTRTEVRDGQGRVVELREEDVNGERIETWTYDAVGCVVGYSLDDSADSSSFVDVYTCDLNNDPVTGVRSYAEDFVFEYTWTRTYGANGLTETVVSEVEGPSFGSRNSTSFSYDSQDRRIRKQEFDGVGNLTDDQVFEWWDDPELPDRLSSLVQTNGAGDPVSSFEWTFDLQGRELTNEATTVEQVLTTTTDWEESRWARVESRIAVDGELVIVQTFRHDGNDPVLTTLVETDVVLAGGAGSFTERITTCP